jgi:hypothetical protein
VQDDQGPVRAPEFPTTVTWLQGGPLKLTELRGRPVLIDNDYAIWQAYANRYWPAKYLIDQAGYLRYFRPGEGGYNETEQAIQFLLREAFPQILLPGVMEPMRDEDQPGAVCYRVTPEVYLGYQRGQLGNVAAVVTDKPSTYRDPGKHADGHAYLDGDWLLAGEYVARPAGASGESRLTIPYMAKDVNIVVHPPTYGGSASIELLQDGAPLPADDAGDDVKVEGGRALVAIDVPRMYRLVDNRDIDRHELTLTTSSDGVALYAFTFGSCLVPGEGEAAAQPPAPPA